ncbi:MAG: LacI family DNA-binding transcriptional regulator [Lachnospiraceae bacterium]|nr:LacI family DNA-binding transcriptional regulator [Lachnospiraceae bacterium]
MEEQRVRISDIADELGLSTATVSNVIHGKTKKISDETIKRVQEKLEERQYIPSMAGILLAQNSSKIIGIFVNDHEKYEGHTLDDMFMASSLNYLSTEIEKQGKFMMIKKAKTMDEIIQLASMWNMDGLVVIGFCQQDYTYLRNHMRIPFVVYDGICHHPERIVNITIDNIDGGRRMGAYFKDMGHRKALCIADNDEDMDRDRYLGFLQEFGEENTKRLIVPMTKQERWEFYEKRIDIFREVTAVFAVSDFYAIDLIHFLTKKGFRIPEEISVAGFDDTPMCEMIYPALTTIRQDGELRAKVAMEKLRELREGIDTETTVMLPVSLVSRESIKKL